MSAPTQAPTRRLHATVMLAALGLASCQWLAGYDDFSGTATNASQAHPCDHLKASKASMHGTLELGTLVLVKPRAANCFWIDETEVTVESYSVFLRETAATPVDWDAQRCAWKD